MALYACELMLSISQTTGSVSLLLIHLLHTRMQRLEYAWSAPSWVLTVCLAL